MTHWVGQEVLAKRKGPGNEFESKRTVDANLRKHMSVYNMRASEPASHASQHVSQHASHASHASQHKITLFLT